MNNSNLKKPAIQVAADGQSATARWRDHGLLGQYKSHAEWRDGIYENAYVREETKKRATSEKKGFDEALRGTIAKAKSSAA